MAKLCITDSALYGKKIDDISTCAVFVNDQSSAVEATDTRNIVPK